VLEATREVPRPLSTDRNKRRTVGVRVPEHPVTRALLLANGRPILSKLSSVKPPASSEPGMNCRKLY